LENDIDGNFTNFLVASAIARKTTSPRGPIQQNDSEIFGNFTAKALKIIENLRKESDDQVRLVLGVP